MSDIHDLLKALDEGTITKRWPLPMTKPGRCIRWIEYGSHIRRVHPIICHYYNYHFTRCISHGASLTAAEASGRAKTLLNSTAASIAEILPASSTTPMTAHIAVCVSFWISSLTD